MTPLPPGWTQTTLGEVAAINPRRWDSEPQSGEPISFVPMSSVEAGSGRLRPSQRLAWPTPGSYTRFQDRDVLFAKITPCMENGKVALASTLAGGRGIGSTEFHVVRATGVAEPRFLLWNLLREDLRKAARGVMRGAAGQLRVPPEFLTNTAVALPPLAEQRRIVAEIEKHFTRLEAAIAALERVRTNLKRYRASTLAAAVSGRLVPTEASLARRDGRTFESGAGLLRRILAERRAAAPAKFNEPPTPETAALSPPPDGWTWATVAQVGSVQLGRQRSPKNASRNYPTPYIRAANITEAGLDLSDVFEMEFTPVERKRYELRDGDIVLSEASGSAAQAGKPAVWRAQLEGCCFQNTVIRVAPAPATGDFLLTAFRAMYLGGHFARIATGVGINHIGAARLSQTAVPLPPLAEQRRIVAEVERRLSIIDKLDATAARSLQQAARLRQAILKRAFEGRLVPQDPNDEPASMLLERIHAERAGASAPKRRRAKAAHA